MRKYRRFVGNLKWRSTRGGDLGVRNANAAQFFEPWRPPRSGISRHVVSASKMAPSPSCHATTGLSRWFWVRGP